MVTLEKIYRELKQLQRKFDAVYPSPEEVEEKDPELEASLVEALEDVKQGRLIGPFSSVDKLMKHLYASRQK